MGTLRIGAMPMLALALTAALAACSEPAGESGPAATPSPTAKTVVIHVSDFMLNRPDLETTGPNVMLEVVNDGPTPHNVAVRDASGTLLMTTRDLSVGESQIVSAVLAPGDYVTFCSLPGHESLGIKGTLRVTNPT